ncbi:MAG TPA: hypothetical protein PLV56_10380 [Synergistales bacterium]|nr:hypothetical protein [Synergistales bacterium]
MSSFRSLGMQISTLFLREQEFLDSSLGDLGIVRENLFHLLALYENDGLSREDLLERSLPVDRKATRALSGLIHQDLIRKEPFYQQKKSWKLFLTEKARKVEPRVRDTLATWNSTLSRGLSEGERAFLQRILAKISRNTEELIIQPLAYSEASGERDM